MSMQNLRQTLVIAMVSLVVMSSATVSVHAAGSGGGGGGMTSGPVESSRSLSPEERSMKAFRSGVKHRDKALKAEAKAASAKTDKKREKALAKAQKEYARAIKKQSEAMRLDPQNYKAANELGFAFRKTGDYRKAIGAYNYALDLNPKFHAATEYRAEAFLALGFLDHTRNAYMVLYRDDRALANQLMERFDEWIREKNGSLSEAEAQFVTWIEERKRIAKMSSDLSMNNTRTWPSS